MNTVAHKSLALQEKMLCCLHGLEDYKLQEEKVFLVFFLRIIYFFKHYIVFCKITFCGGQAPPKKVIRKNYFLIIFLGAQNPTKKTIRKNMFLYFFGSKTPPKKYMKKYVLIICVGAKSHQQKIIRKNIFL